VLGTAMSLRMKKWGLANPSFLADVADERLPNDNSAPHTASITSNLG
jgi:hypothetical protein